MRNVLAIAGQHGHGCAEDTAPILFSTDQPARSYPATFRLTDSGNALSARLFRFSVRDKRTSSTLRAVPVHLCDSSLHRVRTERYRPLPLVAGRTRRVPIENTFSSRDTR